MQIPEASGGFAALGGYWPSSSEGRMGEGYMCMCESTHTCVCAPVCVRVTEQPCVCYVCVSSAERVGGSMRRGGLWERLVLVYLD